MHKKCVICVSLSEGLPEDLAEVASRWDRVPAALKKGILAMVLETTKD